MGGDDEEKKEPPVQIQMNEMQMPTDGAQQPIVTETKKEVAEQE